MYEDILLEQEQKDLLGLLVEAAKNLPMGKREKFVAVSYRGDNEIDTDVHHKGLKRGILKVYEGHLETLVGKGLLRGQYNNSAFMFDVTPEGIGYYQWLKQQAQDRVQQMETTVTSYLSADRFRLAYPAAYQKWGEAEHLLWGSDSEQKLTMIGHLCREAIQEYATSLVERYHPPEVDVDKAHDIARVRAVLNLRRDRLGEREREFLEALLTYWVRVSKLVQRQEHGTQPGGEPFIWDDARRVIFHTAVMMFEIDQSLSRPD